MTTTTVTTRKCMFCGKASRVELTADQATLYRTGTPIQDVLPKKCPGGPARAAHLGYPPRVLGRRLWIAPLVVADPNSTFTSIGAS